MLVLVPHWASERHDSQHVVFLKVGSRALELALPVEVQLLPSLKLSEKRWHMRIVVADDGVASNVVDVPEREARAPVIGP
jgi:hypothetical protein